MPFSLANRAAIGNGCAVERRGATRTHGEVAEPRLLGHRVEDAALEAGRSGTVSSKTGSVEVTATWCVTRSRISAWTSGDDISCDFQLSKIAAPPPGGQTSGCFPTTNSASVPMGPCSTSLMPSAIASR